MGLAAAEQWGSADLAVDFFDVKADLEGLLELNGRRDEMEFRSAEHPALHPGQCAEIVLAGQSLGWLGMLHPRLEKDLGFERSVFLFEMLLDPLLQRNVPSFLPLSKYPQVRRDIALVVDLTTSARDITACIRSIGSGLVRRVQLFDVYQGKGIEEGKKSIALGLVLQDDNDTLTDARIDRLVTEVVERLGNELNAKLRA
jgi:phenylalanyl-tRNA synthetase beta chain